MAKEVKLWKYSFEELLDRHNYRGKKVSRIEFSSDDFDNVTLRFDDDANLTVSYSPDSLMMVDVFEEGNVKRRLIPDGKPTYDEHYCDAMSAVSGSDFIFKGDEFDVQERFSKESLETLLDGYCENSTLEAVEPSFGLQNWLNIRLKVNQTGSVSTVIIGFKFPKNAIHSAIYCNKGEEIHYLP